MRLAAGWLPRLNSIPMAKLFQKFRKKLTNLEGFSVKAGVLAGATYPDTGVKVAKIARMQEFGTSKIPPRPFLRNTVAREGGEWQHALKKEINLYLADKQSLDAVTTRVGNRMVSDIKKTIKEGVAPPISEVTKMMRYLTKVKNMPRNGRTYRTALNLVKSGKKAGEVETTPLYDTHIFYNSIDYE